MELAKNKSLLAGFCRNWKRIIILNFLFLLSSLPIFTIGASMTAAYSVLFKILQGEKPEISKVYWKAWKENLLQAVQIWAVEFIVGGVLCYGLLWYLKQETVSKVLLGFIILVILLYSIQALYVFPLLARYENTAGQIIKNALFISMRYCYRTLQVLFLLVLPIGIGGLLGQIGWLLLLVTPGLVLYFQASLFFRVFLHLERSIEPKETGDNSRSSSSKSE